MSTDVVTPVGTVVSLADKFPALYDMTQALQQHIDQSPSSESFVMSVMERIAAADSFDSIFASQDSSMVAGQDFLNRPFMVESAKDIDWRRSTIESNDFSYPYYAVLNVTELSTENRVVLRCGGSTFVTTLYSLWSRGYFTEPRALMILGHDTGNGFTYLTLTPFKLPEPPRAKGK